MALKRALEILAVLLALILGWMGYLRASIHPVSASPPLTPILEGSKIYFVPIGHFRPDRLQPLVEYYKQKYNLDIAVLNGIPLDLTTKDEARQQYAAERLAGSVRKGFPQYAGDATAILIGFTSEDIYPESKNWKFVFGWRNPKARTAVVSTARLGLHYDGEPLDVNLHDIRLRKVVSKNIGMLYYGRLENGNPRSVLYSQIWGIQELDRVSEDF